MMFWTFLFTLIGIIGIIVAIIVVYHILMASIRDKKGIFVET